MSLVSHIIKIALIGIIGAGLLVSLLSSQDINIQALDFTLSLQIFDGGYTVVDLPPIGTIRARTHQLPLMLRISLRNINLDQLSALVAVEDPETVYSQIQESIRQQAIYFGLRVLAVAFIGGFAGGYIYYRAHKKALLSGLAGLLAFVILVGSTAISYNEKAFREPEFEGIVEAAPWLMGVAEEALAAVEGLDATLQVITGNLLVLFESLRYLGGGNGLIDGELKVLHVSDIHNNPIGVTLVRQMATSFNVDMVIDTGDITDYGTPLEADLARAVNDLDLPWVFVPGNHDSPAIIEAFRQLDNVVVLEEDIFYFEDLEFAIAGVSDPASDSTAMAVRPRDEYIQAADRLRQKIDESEHKPSVIVGHHVWLVNEFTNLPVVLLHGHSHRVNIRPVGRATMIDAGTTGGAGLRGLMTQDELPFSMILLHFNLIEDEWVAVAADIITVHQLNAGFILERKLLHQRYAQMSPLQEGPQDLQENGEMESPGAEDE